ncbi:MAG: hypothetical protein HRU18_01160 [Pseudoalteromonas sp.]|uniref:hypothetical protein n=1 Tax=Pseudoalteromonas sp. TaxID=53249 RepID=UPI001DC8777C|nr:hypothetical protein [Pseudoalteromonas sp.]NRA76788.1 hypothetical protein [Pseudoalteromonas sp.]
MLDKLKNRIAITIQNTVDTLGPMPDKLGEEVKAIVDGKDEIAIMALGCRLEDYMKNRAYPEKTVPKIVIQVTFEKEITEEDLAMAKENDMTIQAFYEALFDSEVDSITKSNGFKTTYIRASRKV